jgi:putative membrane protein
MLLAFFVYSGIIRPLFKQFLPLPLIPGDVGLLTILMMCFSICHAWYSIGWKHTTIFFIITMSVSWIYEEIGVETGQIFGAYHYTDVLGAKFGHVPIIIPLAWFMMIYPSYVIANYITSSRYGRKYSTILPIVLLSLLSAIVMTTWDFIVDPFLSGPTQKAWIWENGGPYFGIPLQNFAGWLLTTFTIYLSFRLFEHKFQFHIKDKIPIGVALLPVMAYGFMMLSNVIPREPPELQFIGPVIMGIPIVMALVGFWKNKSRNKIENSTS